MLRTIIAIVLGLAVGSMVNMGIIMVGPNFVPPPAGVDVTDIDSITANAHLFEAKHFLFPWLAHATGTLAGAIVASLVASARRKIAGLVVAGAFLGGGVMMALSVPAPIWFLISDLGLAYIPMGLLGHKLARAWKPGI